MRPSTEVLMGTNTDIIRKGRSTGTALAGVWKRQVSRLKRLLEVTHLRPDAGTLRGLVTNQITDDSNPVIE